MKPMPPEQAIATPAFELAELPGEALFLLKNEAASRLSAAKALAEHIDYGLALKYADRAQALRLAADKDSGLVHFDDGQVRITADLQKKIDWDQKRLAEIVRRIAEGGEDPAEYIEISYRVSETKFNAWPESLRAAFIPARTLKTGKPGFRLALVGEVRS